MNEWIILRNQNLPHYYCRLILQRDKVGWNLVLISYNENALKNVVTKLNGMNSFTTLGVGGIIIFKCDLDPCGV
jgi:hypothetical protein